MNQITSLSLKTLTLFVSLLALTPLAHAQHEGHTMPHEMQHGFVLGADDSFASHLVAPGHHSRQVEITGELSIENTQEMEIYQDRKIQSAGTTYFLFQAQTLDLPSLAAGQILKGHIVESKLGAYEPKNKIVKSANFRVQKVLLNIPNPFFLEETQIRSAAQPKAQKPHCCDTPGKACNWKC